MMKKNLFYWVMVALSLSACTPRVPADSLPAVEDELHLTPDYRGTTVPYNIAPLNFRIDAEGEEFVTLFGGEDGDAPRIVCGGRNVQIDEKKWNKLLLKNKGKKISVQVYVHRNEAWEHFSAFYIEIAPEPVDDYLCYRLIRPSYVHFENLSIRQRRLSGFEETDLYDTRLLKSRNSNHCINCHSFQQGKTNNMQFHVRGEGGGTVIVCDGKLKKVDLKREGMISAATYPAWHPTESFVAYSVNRTSQLFYKQDLQRVEVQDLSSDLILYDVTHDSVIPVLTDSNALETYPAWSADGKTLYYASAVFSADIASRESFLRQHYDSVHYNLYKVSFDRERLTFGHPEILFDAVSMNRSAALPRVSPDGRFLLFTLARYGTFHIWHDSSDLWLMDLQKGTFRSVDELNSSDAESYHTWSSNGRWVVFSSRRVDGLYTHPYLAYFRTDGTFAAPFVLPQHSPDFYERFLFSFNIPEFAVEHSLFSSKDFAAAIDSDTDCAK